MVRIACVGITVMDRIYYVEGLPTEGGKYVAKRYTEVGGGPAATAAVAAAKLGAQVDFIGRVGDDDTGNSLLAELESLGGKYPLYPPLHAGHVLAVSDYGGCQRRADYR